MAGASKEFDIRSLVAKHARVEPHQLRGNTRVGEDLGIVGDDAEELLTEFSEKFNVDLTNFRFQDYFPDEGTADMTYYLLKNSGGSLRRRGPNPFRRMEEAIWGVFARNKSFKSLTLEQLMVAAKEGEWKETNN